MQNEIIQANTTESFRCRAESCDRENGAPLSHRSANTMAIEGYSGENGCQGYEDRKNGLAKESFM